MQIKSILEILLVAFLIGACSPATPLSAAESVPTQTLLVSNASIPTSFPTATNLPDAWEASKNCVTEYPKKPDSIQLEGVAVLRSLSSTVLSLNLSLQNLKDDSSKLIDTKNQSVWDVGVSPDGSALTYLWFNNNTSKWELVLVDSKGIPRNVAWSSGQEFAFRGWLNDHQFVVSQSKYIVVDPYNDSQLSFSPNDFPNFNLHESKFVFSFDPLLSKTIYKGGNGSINVLDLNSNSIIAHISDGYEREAIARWQPTTEVAAVVASISPKQNLHSLPDEIFIVEKDGQLRQLTHLYDTFGLPLSIENLSWSPDGSKIAFWILDKEANTTLMVADYKTGNIVNHCILNVLGASFPISVSAPVWSPDSKYLMVENRYATDKNRVLIVDLSTNTAFPITENASPVGWMIEKP